MIKYEHLLLNKLL